MVLNLEMHTISWHVKHFILGLEDIVHPAGSQTDLVDHRWRFNKCYKLLQIYTDKVKWQFGNILQMIYFVLF